MKRDKKRQIEGGKYIDPETEQCLSAECSIKRSNRKTMRGRARQSRVIASLWCHSSMELGSVTVRLLLSSDGQMVVVFRPQLLQFGHRDHHQVLPSPPRARTYHRRALQGCGAFLDRRGCDLNNVRNTGHIFFFFFFFTVFTGARFRSYWSLSEYKTNRMNKRKMENREQKKNIYKKLDKQRKWK